MDINAIMAFVTVVECGSFSAAARALDMPRSTVGARVAALEDRLGARLLRRTTRRVALTDDGRRYYDTVAEAITTLRRADQAGVAGADTLAGSIRMSVPLDLPVAPLSHAMTAFLRQHPRVRFDVRVDNTPADFVEDNIDLAIRGGDPGGQHVVVRRIARFRLATFASPALMAASSGGSAPQPSSLQFSTTGRVRAPHPGSPLAPTTGTAPVVTTNSFALLLQLAVDGAGSALLPTHLCAHDVATGKLVALEALDTQHAPEARAIDADLFLVYPSRGDMLPRVRAFAEVLLTSLANVSPD